MKSLDNFRKWYRGLPDKKVYFELLGAVLTIPVLTTVILLNLNSLRNNKSTAAPTPSTEIRVVTAVPDDNGIILEATPMAQKTTQPTPNPISCKQEVGPAEIISPGENQTVTSDSVCIDVVHETGEYCAVVWSYSINGSSWSDFNDKGICLYNLSSGEKDLKVRVKSIASGDEQILQRKFTYQSPVAPTATPTVVAQ